MGIPCPDFLRPLLADLGAEWPDTDESGLRELAEGFRRFATQTSCGQVSVVAEVDWLLAANRGPGIDQVKLFYSRLTKLAGSHHQVASTGANILAANYGVASVIVLGTKLRIIAVLAGFFAQKMAIMAAQAGEPKAAAVLAEVAELTRRFAAEVEQVLESATEALGQVDETLAEAITSYTEVMIPLLQGREMDKRRESGQLEIPEGIDPDLDYRKKLVEDSKVSSPYQSHAEWLPGNPPGRTTQPHEGQHEGGGVWQAVGMGYGAAGQAYQEYATGVKHPGPGGKALEIVIQREKQGEERDVRLDGLTPTGDRAPGSFNAFIDAKDGYACTASSDSPVGGWARGRLLDEAKRQLDAIEKSSPGAVLEWHFSDPQAAEAMRKCFAADNDTAGKVFVFYSPKR